MTIIPNRLTWQQYRNQLWRSLLKSEGDIRRVYSDGKGIPTVGVGLALVVFRTGIWRVRPNDEIPTVLSNRFTTADRVLLQRQARLLNNRLTPADLRHYRSTMITFRGRRRSLWDAAGLGAIGRTARPGQPVRPVRLTGAQIQRLGRIAVPDVGGHSRHIGGGHNRFSFTLRDGEPRRIFNAVIPRFERGARNLILARQPHVQGVSPAAARTLANGLHTAPNASSNVAGHGSREMIALVSVHFNGVLPRRTVEAALRGDRAEAYFEIVYDTNPRRSVGVADRRNHEGAFMLPLAWTDATFNQFVAMKRRHVREISAYENHPDLASLMRQGVSRAGSLRRLRGGRTVRGRAPRLSKFFPGQSRDIDAVLFSANNPNNTIRKLIELGGVGGRLDGRPPVRRAALPRSPGARRAFLAELTAGVRSGREASKAERDAFQAFLIGGQTEELFGSAVKRNLRNAQSMAETEGDARAVAHLQTGLNDLARRDSESGLPRLSQPLLPAGNTGTDIPIAAPAVSQRRMGAIGPLKIDGRLGPKTLSSLLAATAKAGPAAVDQATALARFKDFARRAKATGSPTGLGEAARTSFAPLFGQEKSEGMALQQTINEIDGFTGGTGAVLAEDGAVGPKTEAAFAETMDFADENQFADEFAFNHGFL